MLVRNLVAWAGEGFSYVDGDVIDMPDAMAQARIEAGVAEAARGAGRGRSVLPWLGDVAAPVDPAASPVDPDPAPVDPDPAPLGE
jgi:hypothetical protein